MKNKHKLDYERDKSEKIIKEFSGSFMSNAKWVKLFTTLSSIKGICCEAQVKLVWDESPRNIRIDDDLEYDFVYFDSSMEAMIDGYPKGWYEYKEIEWLWMSDSEPQLELIENEINKLGRFEIRREPNSITLFAYK